MKIPLRKTIGGAIIVLLAFDIFVFDFLSYPKRWLLSNSLRSSSRSEDVQKLTRQTPITVQGTSFYPASLFSTYPLNNKNLIMIDRGSRDQISLSSPVLVLKDNEPFLLGHVIQSRLRESAVQTIFDSGWRGAVRIGSSRVNAFLEGGMPPRVTLIVKDAAVQEGDIVYSASKDYPYGVRIGVLGTLTESSNGFFKEADLEVPYTLSDIEVLFVAKDNGSPDQ